MAIEYQKRLFFQKTFIYIGLSYYRFIVLSFMYLFLDTETHHTDNAIMIQLAYKPSDRLEYYSSLYGTGGVLIDLGSMSVHHITDAEVAGKPLFEETPDKETLQKLLETYTLVAHNAAYDVQVLANR